jgi:hypothetical protein
MRTIIIKTRTLPPTDTEGKRVRVRSQDGGEAVYPWDYSHDDDQVHEEAARKVAMMENPDQPVTLQLTDIDGMGRTFRAVIGS